MDLNRHKQDILLKTAEYAFSSTANRMFSRIDHKIILGHKAKFNKFKRAEIASSFFSPLNHNGIKLEINYMMKNGKILKNKTNKQQQQ